MNVTDIPSIAEALRHAKDRGQSGTLLVGAGCSASAGIPLANDFVNIIKEQFPAAFRRAEEKNFADCMSNLTPIEIEKLLENFMGDHTKINWAHIAIAQLMKAGYISRVLTTNFDSLIMRACFLIGLYPAIYDISSFSYFLRSRIKEKAIFYLHGHRMGFATLFSQLDVEQVIKITEPIISDSLANRPFIVVGYSGDNDPVMETIALRGIYDQGLFWICYKDTNPNKRVRKKILAADKNSFCIKGFDADDFFVNLAQELGCFPPLIITDPFRHLDETLASILPYTISGHDSPVTASVRNSIKTYGDRFRIDNKIKLQARSLLFEGKLEEVTQLLPEYNKSPNAELADSISWALLRQGEAIWNKANRKKGREADELFEEIKDKYAKAVEIKPHNYQAFYRWGNTLAAKAHTKDGKVADALWNEAGEKYAEAVKAKPCQHEAWNNWGSALYSQARTKTGRAANVLLKKACEKYSMAVKVNPDKLEVWQNWGVALEAQANLPMNKASKAKLLKLSDEKFAKAKEIEEKVKKS